MKYKVGMQVRIIRGDGNCNLGDVGKIVKIARKTYSGWDLDYGDGQPKGNWSEKYLEPVTTFEPPFYVDCPTQEIWDKVEKKMFEMGGDGLKKNYWNEYKEESAILLNEDKENEYSDLAFYKRDSEYGKHIPYQQFLGEVKREFKVGDRVKILAHNAYDFSGSHGNATGRIGYIEDEENSVWSQPSGKGDYLGIFHDSELKLITPVEEKEEKHKNLVAEYPLPPMYPSHNDMYLGFGPGVNLPMPERVNPFYKLSKSLMSGFKKATAFIKRLGEPLSTYYSLGWVELENDEFTTTPEGKQALADFTLIGGAKTFEEYAKKELARRKKASKVKDEEED